ncbi:isopentenyl-diphosphate Delta-isomerase [Nesterenkonia sp. PF2B19]|uniref:isopentenyl-diphosphate Delta-isomerase n=1 Tax=unclassified Nesterenkonia TaxID=2629769 RepID=UPI0008724584|nr:isopentenyl-diphosphate Delta-isomerase [Nesterenkonia sp. PF2B19]OSM43561.1 isopentenyl-diphosphate delta-isomerase [Nesterenkonia sp. PF2B19]
MDDRLSEHVVLVAPDGRPLGTALKSAVHTAHTPLHRGFSCHLTNPLGQVLVTRRSLTKRTWPGVWTNSFCGHPAPGESLEEAVVRHARHELTIEVTDVTPVLPDFSYRAVDASGVVEHEICPVVTAALDGDPVPNPDEVLDWRWTSTDRLRAAVDAAPWAFSPWLVLQVPAMALYGGAGESPHTPEGSP